MALYEIAESEIPVKYGMINLRQEREGARHSLRYIVSDFNDIKSTYFNLGFHLDEFIRCKYYEDFGYTTFKEFCIENLPLDYSLVNRCISVYNMTCQRQDGGLLKTNRIKDEYIEYSYSQLVEMVSMNNEQRNQVKPDMSVRQIRDIKSKKDTAPIVNCDVATNNIDMYDGWLLSRFIDVIYNCYGIKNLSNFKRTPRSFWFQCNGKQYKVMISISDIKEDELEGCEA